MTDSDVVVAVHKSKLQAVGGAIRTALGVQTQYELDDMPAAIGSIGGGGVTVEALSVTDNGTYTAPSGKAYSPVTVNVSGGSSGVYVGTDAPTSSIGSNGDYYYRRARFPYGYQNAPTSGSSTSQSGYEFTANSNISVVGLRGYVRSSVTGSLMLGDSSGNILKQVNDIAFSANDWTEVTFDSPVQLTSGSNYIVMIAASALAYQYASGATFASTITYVRGRYGGMPGSTDAGILYGADIIVDSDVFYVTEQYRKESGAWEKIA